MTVDPAPGTLRRLGRRVRSANRELAFFRDFGLLAGAQVISRVLGFVAFAWLARRLDPVHYGAVEYVVGLSVFFTTIVDGGLGALGTRRVSRDPALIPLLAFQIPVARLLIAAIGIPVMALIAVRTMDPSMPVALVGLFALSLLPAPWRQQWLLQATERMNIFSVSEVLRMAVFAAVVVVLVRGSGDILFVGAAEIAAVAVTTVFTIWMQHRHVTPLRLTGSLAGFRALIREGSAIGSSNLVWAFNQFAPLFLIASLLGGAQVAWFAGASRIIVSLVQFSNIYHFNMYPSVARAYARHDDTLATLLGHSMRITAWAGCLCAAGLTVYAGAIIHLTLGAKLAPAAPLLQIMAWLIPIALMSGHSRWGLVAAGAQIRVLWTQIIGSVVTIIASIGLGFAFGATGYAIGSLAGYLAVWLVSHRFARQNGCAPPPFHLALRPIAAALAVIASAAALSFEPIACTALLAAMLVAMPLIDRRVIGDALALGRSKRSVSN